MTFPVPRRSRRQSWVYEHGKPGSTRTRRLSPPFAGAWRRRQKASSPRVRTSRQRRRSPNNFRTSSAVHAPLDARSGGRVPRAASCSARVLAKSPEG